MALAARELDLGQVFTPDLVAAEMANILDLSESDQVRLLDPGAGHGALAEAVISRCEQLGVEIHADLVELDPVLAKAMRLESPLWHSGELASVEVYESDFVDFAARSMASMPLETAPYTHVIMNPPYARIPAQDTIRGKLIKAGVTTPNMYAAFMWLASNMLADGGQLVAIVPRSFCNGRQFLPLREHMFGDFSLETLVTFEGRDRLFARDQVLQEVVIVALRKTKARSKSVSLIHIAADGSQSDQSFEHGQIVDNADDLVIKIPTVDEGWVDRSSWPPLVGRDTVAAVGPVVDFRTPSLTETNSFGYVPLIDSNYKALSHRPKLRPMRYLPVDHSAVRPLAHYVVISRVSPNERTPRIRYCILSPEDFGEWPGLAFENHVLVISGPGLDSKRAEWIGQVLSHPDTDRQFRERSGSTQINLADLLALRVPPGLQKKSSGEPQR